MCAGDAGSNPSKVPDRTGTVMSGAVRCGPGWCGQVRKDEMRFGAPVGQCNRTVITDVCRWPAASFPYTVSLVVPVGPDRNVIVAR